MIYLASPYSSRDPAVMELRFEQTMEVTASLVKLGKPVWSPIVHCHEMAKKYNLPKDAGFWKRYNFDFIRRADYLYVLKLPGWEESIGVTEEIEFANTIYLPIVSILPEDYIKP